MIYFKCNSFNFPIMFNFTHDLITYAHPHLSLMLSVFFLHSFIIILQSWNYVYGRPWIKYVIINNVSCARNNRMSIIFLFFFHFVYQFSFQKIWRRRFIRCSCMTMKNPLLLKDNFKFNPLYNLFFTIFSQFTWNGLIIIFHSISKIEFYEAKK